MQEITWHAIIEAIKDSSTHHPSLGTQGPAFLSCVVFVCVLCWNVLCVLHLRCLFLLLFLYGDLYTVQLERNFENFITSQL